MNGEDETLPDVDSVLPVVPKDLRPFVRALLEAPVEDGGNGPLEIFMALRQDARLQSLIELAMRLDSDDLDQLLFVAEDYYSESVLTGG